MNLIRFAEPNSNKMRSGSTHLTRLILAVYLFTNSGMLFALPPNTGTDQDYAEIKPSGIFTWVDARRASYVAAPITPISDSSHLEEKSIIFGKRLTWHDGTICSSWELRPNQIYCAFLEDPLLGDTQLHNQSSNSHAPLLNQGYEVICEGVSIGSLTDIDGRTLIVPMYNSTINSLFEKPVTKSIILEMARVLQQRNFTPLPPETITQQQFREAISAYVSHSSGFNLKFYRSPITWNVMDSLIERPELRKQIWLDRLE
ncbi:MAG: hypothetical protein GY814_04685 [Gammaproteobacteria bacterium]|nr:hypothetical protein [Gammaproteobacteria bacterium]